MKKNIFIYLLIILLLGTFLRFYRIDFLSLWYDEVAYMQKSENFFNSIPDYLLYKDGLYNNLSSPLFSQYSDKSFAAAPSYFFFMNFWINLFGNSEAALRSFSAIAGILSIIFIFLIAKRFFKDKVALLSAFLFAINPYNIVYSQEATYYTLTVLIGLISVFFFIKSLKENKLIYWLFYALFSAFGIYTHPFFVFIPLFESIFFIISLRTYKKLIKNFIISQILIIIIYVPWLPHLYYANLYTNNYFWLDVLHYIDLPSTLIVFGIGQTLIRKQSSLYLILPVLFFYFIGFIIPFLIGIFPTKLKRIRDFFNTKLYEKELFLSLYLFVPITILFISSILFRPMFQWQYVMLASPAFYILISRGIFRIKKNYFRFILLFTIILLCALSLYYYYSTPIFKGDWRAASKYIEEHELPGDLIIVHSPQVIPVLEYYYKGNLPIKGFPDIPKEKLNEENIVVTEKNIADIYSVIKNYKRVWLIQRLVRDKEETIPNYLDKNYKRLYFNKFVWVRVYLYQL